MYVPVINVYSWEKSLLLDNPLKKLNLLWFIIKHVHSLIKPLDFILIKLLILFSSMISSNDNIFVLNFDLQQQREKESACIRVEVLNCIYHQCN